MSKAENNPLLKHQSGMIGRTMVIRQVNGRTIISNAPRKRDQPTAHQLKTKEKFMRAVDYARRQMAVPEIKALYQKAVNRDLPNAYTAALKDYLNAPVVSVIDAGNYKGQAGDPIFIVASDDFEVRSVTVAIHDATGALLEGGEARKRDLHLEGWEYFATAANASPAGSRIVVTVKDRPGNEGMKDQVI